MRRRDFLKGVSGVAGLLGWAATGAVTPEDWNRLLFTLRHPGRVDPQTVTNMEQITVQLARLDPQMPPRALLGSVLGHLDLIAWFLDASLTPSVRRQLQSVGGETAALAGLLYYDLDDESAAATCCRIGLSFAQDSGDRALGAYLLGRVACQPTYREWPAKRL